MTDEVFAEYKAAIPGLESPEDFIVTKKYRLAHPCKFKEGGPSFLDNPPYFDTGRSEDLPVEEHEIYIGVNIKDIDKMNNRASCDDPEDFANNPECSNQ